MSKSTVIHLRSDRKRTKCGLDLTWSRDPRFQGTRPKGITRNKKKVTCKNCLRTLETPPSKVHYVPYPYSYRTSHTALCGFVWRPFQFHSDIIFEDQGFLKDVSCEHCKRILKKCKEQKKK